MSLKLNLEKLREVKSMGSIQSPRIESVLRTSRVGNESSNVRDISPPITQVRDIPQKIDSKKKTLRSRSNSLVL